MTVEGANASFDAVILAGGAARRLDGAHKPSLQVGSRRLLDVAVDAVAGATRIVVAGPMLATAAEVVWVREQPPGGGPVAALAAALERCSADEIVLLAADLPFVTTAAVASLRSVRGAGAAALAIDHNGRDQPMLACYDRPTLQAAMPRAAAHTSMRALVATLDGMAAVHRIDLGGDPPVTWDCDTADELARARRYA